MKHIDFSSLVKGTNVQCYDFDDIMIDSEGTIVLGRFDRKIIVNALDKGNKVILVLTNGTTSEDEIIRSQKGWKEKDIDLMRCPEVTVICDDDHRCVFQMLVNCKDEETLFLQPTFGNISIGVILLLRDQNRVDHVNNNLFTKLPGIRIYEAVDAMTPYAIDKAVRNTQVPILKPIRAGKIGCIFSHLSVWNQFIDSRSDMPPAMLILEDDTEPIDDFENKFNQVLDKLPTTFDILFLYVSPENEEKLNKNLIIQPSFPVESTSSYLISRRGAIKLLKTIKCIREPIGSIIKRQIELHKIEAFTVSTSLFDNIGQKTSNQIVSNGMLKSNVCDSKIYIP